MLSHKTNQTTWRKGQSGNLNGAPKKGESFSSVLRMKLDEIPDGSRITLREMMAARLVKMAVEGDLGAIREAASRDEGTPLQRNDITSGSQEFVGPIVYLPKEED